jgi:S-DNA-T family DNA segregation ATPase FtsK/SpoIIIE
MKAIVTVSSGQWRPRDVFVDADPEVPAREIVEELSHLVAAEPGSTATIDSVRGRFALGAAGSVEDDPAARAPFDAGIADGSTVVFGAPPTSSAQETGAVELVTVSGPGTGAVQALQVGETTLGVGPDGTIVTGGAVHSPLAALTVAYDGTTAVRLSDSVDGSRYLVVALEEDAVTHQPITWDFGSYLHVGTTILRLRRSPVGAGQLRPDNGSATLMFNRPPRLTPPPVQKRFTIPAPPKPPNRGVMPWIMALGPLVISVILALALRHPFYLVFGLVSPVMMLGSWFSNRKNGIRTHRQMLADHKADVEEIREAIAASVRAETAMRREAYPDPSDLRRAATMPTRRLWERRRSAEDFLRVRVGVGSLASGIEVTDNSELEYKRRAFDTLHHVPVTVDLDAAGVVGVAGPGEFSALLGRWMVGQVAALHLPRDVRLFVLSPGSRFLRWEWTRWLPHVLTGSDDDRPVATVGHSAESVMARIGELTQILAERLRTAGEDDREFTAPDVIVTVLDGARNLRSLPGVLGLLRDGPRMGMYTICLDETSAQLPEECAVEVVSSAEGRLRVSQHHADAVSDVAVDTVDPGWFETVSRAMSPLREVGEDGQEGQIPERSRLLPLLGMETPTAQRIADAWALAPRSTSAVVGESFDGPFQLDISRDGPHALVAGTTGSGKSEFLQTLVSSLAAANRPDEMNFVLVDYKGGAAFAACSNLPHAVGFVTDLDHHLVQRALVSLSAELVRREHLLALVGAKDIEDYQAATEGTRTEGLARLVIVIDEFAALAKELPDFVTGLVGIAQRGRSLGVHLVLATQRPTGVVSTEIRANVNLRVALRVTDKTESSDVIDAGDAARISQSTPGRAFARLGHASLIPFQSARIGGRREHVDASALRPEAFVSPLSLDGFASAPPRRPESGTTVSERTDLEVLVEAIGGADRDLAIPRPPAPWLPPLPEQVGLGALLPQYADLEPRTGSMTPIAWALRDLPSTQSQEPLRFDLDLESHLFVAGSPGSGRTQALRTIAGSAALLHSPADVHMYGIDCGSGGLGALESLPHCGGVSRAGQTERTRRILARLRSIVSRRSEILAEGSFSNLQEQRAAAREEDRLPHVLLFIDRWESFVQTLGEIDAGALTDQVHMLLAEGVSTGVHLMMAGDRSLLATRISHLAANKVMLRFDDRIDLSLGNLKPKDIPESLAPGRAFQADSGIECQVAVLQEASSGPDTALDVSGGGQAAALRSIGERSRVLFPDARPTPRTIVEMPKSLSIDRMFAFPEPGGRSSLFAALGVGGDDVTQQGPDLGTDAPTFVVAGPARSGRSTVLRAMAESLLRRGTSIVVLAPMASPVRDLEGRDGVLGVFTELDVPAQELADLVEGRPGTVIVMDDGEMLKEMPARTWLRGFIRDAKSNEQGLIVGGDLDELGTGFGTAWNVDVKRARRGIVLSPSSAIDGDLIGVKISRSVCSSRVVLGTGYAHFGTGVAEPVRLAG